MHPVNALVSAAVLEGNKKAGSLLAACFRHGVCVPKREESEFGIPDAHVGDAFQSAPFLAGHFARGDGAAEHFRGCAEGCAHSQLALGLWHLQHGALEPAITQLSRADVPRAGRVLRLLSVWRKKDFSGFLRYDRLPALDRVPPRHRRGPARLGLHARVHRIEGRATALRSRAAPGQFAGRVPPLGPRRRKSRRHGRRKSGPRHQVQLRASLRPRALARTAPRGRRELCPHPRAGRLDRNRASSPDSRAYAPRSHSLAAAKTGPTSTSNSNSGPRSVKKKKQHGSQRKARVFYS